MRPRLGVIGLGRMGLPICARLVEQGLAVCGTDLRPECRAAAVEAGVRWTESPEDVAASSDVVITVLPGPKEVAAVLDPVLGSLPSGAMWIDMSTATPALAVKIATMAQRRNIRTLDAPVGGNPGLAREGRLLAFVGGTREDLDSHHDVLDTIAERVLHVGASGSGYVVKLLVNYLWFGQALAAAEAFSIAARSGLDPETLRSAVQESAAATSFMEQGAQALLSGDDLTSFSLTGCHEELTSVLALGKDLDVPLAVGERVTELYAQALDRYGDVDGELLGARLVAERAAVTFGQRRRRGVGRREAG